MANESNAKEHFDVYVEHSKSLRAWLIAYGVGFFAMLLANEAALKVVAKANDPFLIVLMFVIGVVAQVVLVFINKYIMWFNYRSLEEEFESKSCMQICCAWLSKQIWIDVTLDVLSVALFSIATLRIVSANVVGL